MDFNNHIRFVIDFGLFEFWVTDTVFSTWVVSAVLILFAIVVRMKIKNFTEVPKGFQNVVEMIVEMFDGFVASSAGEKFAALGNWYFMVFAFILCSNLSGLFTLRPPTTEWPVPLALALSTFFIIHYQGFKHKKAEYFKGFLEPYAVFVPLNIIGELSKPVSLSFRLFGNILGGMILLTIYYNLTPWFVQLGIPTFLHAYFDLVGGVLQTYVFSVLSLSFIRNMAGDPA